MKGTPRTAVAVLVAVLALILSAGAGATASILITGKQIKDGTVTTADVKNRSLKARDFSAGAKSTLRGPAGSAGARGATGATGPAGPAGPAGLSGFEVVRSSIPLTGLLSGVTSAACPAGKQAIAATGGASNPLLGVLTQVTRLSDTAFKATALSALPIGANSLDLDVVCATVAR